MFLIGCDRAVHIRDVQLTDAALWCVRLSGCEDVVIHGITIDSDLKYPNADGIDLDRCRRVRISDCEISCGDDAISLKTCEEFPDLGPTRTTSSRTARCSPRRAPSSWASTPSRTSATSSSRTA